MSLATQRLGAVRRVHRRRNESRPVTGVLYNIYAIVLVGMIAVLPLAWGLTGYLSRPAAVAVLASPHAGVAVAAFSGLGLAGLAAAGPVRGPALRSPFMVTVLAGSDLPRSRTLLSPFLASIGTLIAVSVVAAGTIGSVLTSARQATVLAAFQFVAAVALFALLSGVVCLGGQALGRGRAWPLPTALLAITLLTTTVPGSAKAMPWGWLGLLWPGIVPGSWWALALLAAITIAALTQVPRLLNMLRGPALLQQSQRWQVAGLATATADFADALAIYRAPPSIGRNWRAIIKLPLPLLYLRRDLVATLRTPGRMTAATAFLLVAGFITAFGAAGTGWVALTAGAAAGFMALGVCADGFRHAAATAGAPALYRFTTGRLYALHAVFPCLWGAAGMAGGGLLAHVLFGAPGSWGTAVALATFLVAVRAYDSAKGLLPPILLTPSPSPAGDLTGLMVLAWQADALLIAIATPGVLAAAGGSALALAISGGLTILTLILLTRRRLRHR